MYFLLPSSFKFYIFINENMHFLSIIPKKNILVNTLTHKNRILDE
jgi:hypothetical protein